jgi:hypothetical protein
LKESGIGMDGEGRGGQIVGPNVVGHRTPGAVGV